MIIRHVHSGMTEQSGVAAWRIFHFQFFQIPIMGMKAENPYLYTI